jgi:hypothetical protein
MAAGVRAGELSAAELVADALAAAAALDPVLHFVDSLAPRPALAAAARIDGLPRGQRDRLPLAGVPFLAKAGTGASTPATRGGPTGHRAGHRRARRSRRRPPWYPSPPAATQPARSGSRPRSAA